MAWSRVAGGHYGDPDLCNTCLEAWYGTDGDEERECWKAPGGLIHLRRTAVGATAGEFIEALDGRLPTYCGLAVVGARDGA